jgi:hypothetical protein
LNSVKQKEKPMLQVNLLSKLILSSVLIFGFASQSFAQDYLKKLRVSPEAEVMQVVGLTKVAISYSRPGVKGRKIWGGLVPYDKVWRAGADEATKITITTDVMIEGKKLSAGSYSFFVIPTKKEWTIIFNKVADQWGAFEYNEAEDALRLKVKPKTAEFEEWLKYEFVKTGDYSANLCLHWEKLKVVLKLETKF